MGLRRGGCAEASGGVAEALTETERDGGWTDNDTARDTNTAYVCSISTLLLSEAGIKMKPIVGCRPISLQTFELLRQGFAGRAEPLLCFRSGDNLFHVLLVNCSHIIIHPSRQLNMLGMDQGAGPTSDP